MTKVVIGERRIELAAYCCKAARDLDSLARNLGLFLDTRDTLDGRAEEQKVKTQGFHTGKRQDSAVFKTFCLYGYVPTQQILI